MTNLITSARGITTDVWWGLRRLQGVRSRIRWAGDVVLYRALRFSSFGLNRPRSITTRTGAKLHYRLNRGDIHTVVEVWELEVYRPPDDPGRSLCVVDLGLNVGLTSLWLATHHDVARIIGVEPVLANAAVARANLALSGADVTIVDAAVGPVDGTTTVRPGATSTTGGTGSGGSVTVPVVSMATVLRLLPPGRRVDLLKVDIEGAEGELFAGDVGWLERCDRVVMEIHGTLVDKDAVIGAVRSSGFDAHEIPDPRSFGATPGETVVWFTRSGPTER